MGDEITAWRAPWHDRADEAHAHIQRALAILERSAEPTRDLTGAAAALVAALGRLYDAVDGRAEPLASVVVAQKALAAVAEAIEAALDDEGALSDAVRAAKDAARAMDSVAEALARTPKAPRALSPNGRIAASREELRAHRVARSSLLPQLRLPTPRLAPAEAAPPSFARPTSFEELEEAGAKIAERVRAHLDELLARPQRADEPPQVELHGQEAFVARWSRELLEEVAMLGLHRRPLVGDDWRASLYLEQRMLSAVDAFAALGAPALERLEDFVIDAPLREPSRLFAATLVAGCIDGRDAIGMVERLLRDATPNEDLLAAAVKALELAPHSMLVPVLRALLRDGDPALRALAAEVLAHRELSAPGLLEDAELLGWTEDRPEVAVHALLPLAARGHPDAEALLARAHMGKSARLREGAWVALAARLPSRALRMLREAIDDERAALLLSLGGDPDDARRLLHRARQSPTPWRLDALGFVGSVEAVPALIDQLADEDLELCMAAARSLERLTGAGLIEEIEVPPEDTVPRELPELPVAELATPARAAAPPLAGEVSSPRDAPSEGSPDLLEAPSIDADRWAAYWKDHARDFEAGRRYRRGKPWSSASSLEELDGPLASPAERQLLQIELAGASRRYVHLDVDDLVVVQERALAGWRALLRS